MIKKIKDFINRHEMGALYSAIAVGILLSIILSSMAIKFNIELPLLITLVVFGYVYMSYEYHKNRKALKKVEKGWSISELKNFYSEHLNAVNQTIAEFSYSVDNDHNWLFTFDKTVRDVLLTINNSRRFSSFEFASCLIYSLSVTPVVKLEDPSKQLLFAFSCAKKLISRPNFYNIESTFPSKVFQSFEISDDEWEEVNFDFPNEWFSEEAICIFINVYISSGRSEDLLQFSDLLQKMYSMSCTK